jgi:hypothetical protein
MDDGEHCAFVVGVKNEQEFQKIVQQYQGCFSDISFLAHGCPAGLEEAKQQNQGENFCKLLQSEGGVVTALSCGLLSTQASGSGIPVFVSSCCRAVPKGTIIKGSTTVILTSPIARADAGEDVIETPFCQAHEICYECDGKGGATLKTDCGGLIPGTAIVDNISSGHWGKKGNKWIWVQETPPFNVCTKGGK